VEADCILRPLAHRPGRRPLGNLTFHSKEITMKFGHTHVSPRPWALALCVAGSLFGATLAGAAGPSNMSEAQAVYQAERAHCLTGQSHQDRATCLKEAGAAYQEARSGRLGNGDGQFERNRLARCDAQLPEDRADCVRKLNGEGQASGSVKGGGILRELTTTVPISN
jgi:hypothetical protein